MTQVNNPIDKWQVILASSLIAGAGGMMFGAFPVFLAAIAKQLGLDEEQVGYLPSAFYLGYTLLSISAVFWVRNVRWKLAALVGLGVTALPLYAMMGIENYTTMLILMVIGGSGMGIIYSLATTILSDSSNPDRVFGIKLAVETMPGTALLFLLPMYVIPTWGFNGVALAMGACATVAVLCIFWIPKRSHRKETRISTEKNQQSSGESSEESPEESTLMVWLGLAALTLYFIAVVCPWVFLQFIGESINLPAGDIGSVLSIGLFISIIGGFVAAAIGTRFGHIPPMLVTMGTLFTALIILAKAETLSSFTIGSLMLLATLNIALSYLLGITARVDKSGRLIVLSTAAIAGAVIIGPSIAGNLIIDGNFTPMLWFSGACGAASLALYITVALRAHVDEQQAPDGDTVELATAR